ncbi:MAG: hypothetical protein KDB61_02055 [Planctomycetes bacterium]|nr:hypothetical protein [Planctomycetota bacterium]
MAWRRGLGGIRPWAPVAVWLMALALTGPLHAQRSRQHTSMGSVATANSLAPPPLAGGPVARFTHPAPTRTSYVLHGTLPIPAGTWDGNRQHPSLAFQNYDGSLAPTQMEVVTRNAVGEPEVVELIGRVKRDPAVAAGTPIDFEVVAHGATPMPFVLRNDVMRLLHNPGQIVMHTTDVFGNRYQTDLMRDLHGGTQRVLKQGECLEQFGGHRILTPVAGSDASTRLPHMMGVKVYTTVLSGSGVVALDLVVHNAMSDLSDEISEDDLLDDMYFENLALEIPAGWTVLSAFNNPYESDLAPIAGGARQRKWLVTALDAGRMHLLVKQGRFTRRMLLAPDTREGRAEAGEILRREDLALLKRPRSRAERVGLWSWWNPDTAYYFPQKFVLPILTDFDLDLIRDQLETRYHRIALQTENGTSGLYPFTAEGMGWCHPWGDPYGGMPGGDEINFVDGLRTLATESIDGYRLAEITAKAYMDRQAMAFYGLQGEPLRLRDLVQVDGQGRFYVDAHFQLSPSGVHGYPRFDESPKHHIEQVASLDLKPEYESEMRRWVNIDIQHLIRYTRSYKTLIWLGNDELAKDEMRLLADIYRLSYPEVYSSGWGYVQGTGLLYDQLRVAQFPHQGADVGRGEAWGMDAACTAYLVSDAGFRTRFRPWFQIFADMVRDGQSACTGNVVSFFIANHFNGQYRVRQSFEVAMIEQALHSLSECVFRDLPGNTFHDLRNVAAGSTYASLNAPYWNPLQHGPWFIVGTGSWDNNQTQDFCDNVPSDAFSPGVDFTDYWNAIAYTYYDSPDPFLMSRMNEMLAAAPAVLGASPLVDPMRIEARAAMLVLKETPLP